VTTAFGGGVDVARHGSESQSDMTIRVARGGDAPFPHTPKRIAPVSKGLEL
jgi:hypothetical protein